VDGWLIGGGYIAPRLQNAHSQNADKTLPTHARQEPLIKLSLAVGCRAQKMVLQQINNNNLHVGRVLETWFNH